MNGKGAPANRSADVLRASKRSQEQRVAARALRRGAAVHREGARVAIVPCVDGLGHRNPQGLAWDDDGQLYAAEHGQSGHDEVNLIERGANYGWPLIQGDETADGMRAPLTHSGGGTWAPSGLAWTGDDLLLAGLQAEGVLSVGLDGEVSMHHPTGERIRDVLVVGADIYVITTNRSPRGEGPSRDRLIRLDP